MFHILDVANRHAALAHQITPADGAADAAADAAVDVPRGRERLRAAAARARPVRLRHW